MKKNIDLLNENVLISLTGLALPVMATSPVQTAYNLTDMAWIGMVGSGAVAAVGATAVYTWLSSDVTALAKMGGRVKSVHAYGEGNRREVIQYGKGVLQLALVLVAAYGIITDLFVGLLIGFFHLNSSLMVEDATVHPRIAYGLILFAFTGRTLTGLYTASGNSRTPFVASCIGMGANIVLDPPLISGLGLIHGMGVVGAAVAAVTAQFIVSLVLMISMRKSPVLTAQMRIWIPTPLPNIKTMVQIEFPATIQSMLYYGAPMILTRLVTTQGDTAMVVQRVGGQIEFISWMTADGFGIAVSVFVGQNYGTENPKRVKKGYMTTPAVILIWGIFTTCPLISGVAPIFSLFIHRPEIIPTGTNYLRVIGFSKTFMCVELMTVGALSGIGKIMEVSIVTIILTTVRIPLTAILDGMAPGLNGIWWALIISSAVKGVILFGYYLHIMKRMKAQAPRLICCSLIALLCRMNL